MEDRVDCINREGRFYYHHSAGMTSAKKIRNFVEKVLTTLEMWNLK